MSKTFNTSLVLGDQGEKVVEAYMKQNNIKFRRTLHSEYEGMSFEADYFLGPGCFAECKCLGGTFRGSPVSTLVIEKYKNTINPMYSKKKGCFLGMDEDEVKYPGWIRTIQAGKTLTLYFINRYNSYMYIFDGKKLYDHVMDYDDSRLTIARDENKDDSGFIAKVDWESADAGFIKKVKFDARKGDSK
jgi:hypothetical protein